MSLEEMQKQAKDIADKKLNLPNDNEEIELTNSKFNSVLRTYQGMDRIEYRLDSQHNELIHSNLLLTLKIIFIIGLTVLYYTIGGKV